MLRIKVNKADALLAEKETLTSGRIGLQCGFEFNEAWEGLGKTAVFVAGSVQKDVLLDNTNVCEVPYEVMETAGINLRIGVYGTDGDNPSLITIPTIWCGLGVIVPGADPSGDAAGTATPTLVDQMLAAAQECMDAADEAQFYAERSIIEAAATADANTGTPSVSVTVGDGATGKKATFAFHNLKGSKGDKGDKGDQGESSVAVEVGTTTTGAAGSQASVTNSGTVEHAILNFTIPRGNTGEKGDKGDKGEKGDTGEVTQAEFDALEAIVTAQSSQIESIEDSIENGILNQYVKINPFVIGTAIGAVTGNRATISVLQDGSLKIVDAKPAGNTTYGFWARIKPADRRRHILYIAIKGLYTGWSAEGMRRMYVGLSNASVTLISNVFETNQNGDFSFLVTIPSEMTDVTRNIEVSLFFQTTSTSVVGQDATIDTLQVCDLTEKFGEGFEPSLEAFERAYPDIGGFNIADSNNSLKDVKAITIDTAENYDPNGFSCDPVERELYRKDMLSCAASYLVHEKNCTCVVGTPTGIDTPFIGIYGTGKGYECMYNDTNSSKFIYTDTYTFDGSEYPVVYLDCTAFVGLLTKCIPYAESPMHYAFNHLPNPDYKTMFNLGFSNGSYITKPYTFDLHGFNSVNTDQTAYLANHSGNRLRLLRASGGAVDEKVFQSMETGDILYTGSGTNDRYRHIHHIQVFLKTLDELNEYGAVYGVTFKSSEKFDPDPYGLHGYVIEVGEEREGYDCIHVVSLDSYIAAVPTGNIWFHKANATPFNSIKAARSTFNVIDHALYL